MLEHGKCVRSPPSEGKGTAEMCDELTTAPFPHPLCATGEEGIEKLGVNISSGRREVWEEGVLRIRVYFSMFDSGLINKSN